MNAFIATLMAMSPSLTVMMIALSTTTNT
jgi:hypothetical protein